MKKIKIFIISFNRLAVLKESISSYRKFLSCKEIFIIDKGSSYKPLLEYYDELASKGVTIIYSEPMTAGPEGPGGLNDLYKEIDKYKVGCDYYIVTDPDISVERCKKDLLSVYISILEQNSDIDIVGPMLKIDDIPINYPARELCFRLHVGQFWFRKPIKMNINNKDIYVQKAAIDSTFGMVRVAVSYRRLLRGFRTYYPYGARHLDWYITPENITKDQVHYLENTSKSTVSHWSAGLYNKQPSFIKLTGDKRKIYTTRVKWQKVELITKYLTEMVHEDERIEFIADSTQEPSLNNINVLSQLDIDMIRDTAIILEKIDTKLSLELMSIANLARPGGVFIKKLLEKYRKALKH